MEIADRHASARIVSVLEGGYDLTGLADSAAAHVAALMAA
jgi:acetoin utilization deacetylase AcuC-like enzyme